MNKQQILNDRCKYVKAVVISALYILFSVIIIRNLISTSYLKYGICFCNFIYPLLLYVNEFGNDSFKEMRQKKGQFFFLLIIASAVCIVTFFVFSKHVTEKNQPFVFYYSIIQPLVNLLPFFFFFNFLRWRFSYKKVFLISNVILGIFFMIFITPGEVPDENTHFGAAYRVSNKIMHYNNYNYYVVREDDKKAFEGNFAKDVIFNETTYNAYLGELPQKVKKENLVYYKLDQLKGDDFLYVLPALGISLGRTMKLGTYATFMLGRCFNFIFYLVITYISFSILPIGNSLLLLVTMLPITLQQVISVSYDCPLFALCFLAFALTLKLIYKEKNFDKKDVFISLLMFISVFEIKSHAYFLIGAMPLLIIIGRVLNEKMSLRTKRKYIVIFLIIVFIALTCYLFFYYSGRLEKMTYKPNTVNWFGAIPTQESYSIPYFIKYPIKAIELLRNTIVMGFFSYYRATIGSNLGWYDITLPNSIIYLLSICLFVASLRRENENLRAFHKNDVRLFLFVSILTVLFIYFGLAIGWTPITYNVILGIQGRYFTPFIPFIYIVIKKMGIVIDIKTDKWLTMLSCIIALIANEALLFVI